MWSAKNESRIRSNNITMNNTRVDSGSPTFLVPQVPTFQVKRLADLNNDFRTMSTKKRHQSNHRNMSATTGKYSSRKSLSQNMSTSKKLAVQKRTDHSIVKRSIDFTNTLKSELQQYTKNNKTEKTPSKPLVNDNLWNSDNNVSRYSAHNFTITNNTPLVSNIKEKTSIVHPILKQTPKSIKSLNIHKTQPYNLPDKENLPSAFPLNGLSALINSHSTDLDKFNVKPAIPNASHTAEIKDLLQKNSNIMKDVMDMMIVLLENNTKLTNLVEENGVNSTVKEPSVSKQLIFQDKKEVNCVKITSSTSKSKTDLRKSVLFNAEYKKAQPMTKIASPKVKKSLKMYTDMKSSMKFLKTPIKDGKFMGLNTETPNTRCISDMSANVQQQLKLLYDSPDN